MSPDRQSSLPVLTSIATIIQVGLLALSVCGFVYPETILGEKVYRSLAEIPFAIDMVDIFRKPNAFDAVADACIARGDVKVFWGQLGLVNNEAAQKAKDAGMKVVQNYCTKLEHKALM